MAPPTKKQKTEEEPTKDEEMKEEDVKEEAKPAVPEPPKELEEDAPADSKPKVKDPIAFATADTTMNVMPCPESNVLMTLSEGGMQNLLAGARANTGLKGGRYMFEVKVVELLTPTCDMGRGPKPKQLVKVGVAPAGSSLLLEGGVAFDSEGFFHAEGKKTKVCGKFQRDSIVSCLLNLDASSPNANTVSLFVGGKRVAQPQALPESLKGKALFPAVTFRNATLHYNFGPTPLCPLPFKCRMAQDATKTDTVAAKSEVPADGKYEVVVPVGLPEEGAFDWLDQFMASHPGYVELSDRMVLDWADKSGVFRQSKLNKGSNDKPDFNFGIREMDDFSIRRAIMSMAPLQSRNYVVMELKDNLNKDSRSAMTAKFGDGFKKVAHVVVGEPPAAFKKKTLELTLAAKQEASDAAFKAKQAEEKRKKMIEKRQKEAEKARKKAEKVKAKALKKAQAEIARKKAEAEAKKEGKELEEEKKEEEPEEEEEEPEEPEEKVEEDTEEPPKAELDAEEKKLWYRKTAVPDMSSYVLSSSFTKFSMPEKDEGFDDVKYEWAKGPASAEYLKKWILERKLTTKMEDLNPSPWFNTKNYAFQSACKMWHNKVNEYKAKIAKKAADKARKEALAKQKAAAKAAAAAKKEKEAKEAAEKGEEPKEEEKKEEEPEPEEPEEPEEEEVAVDFDGIDVFGVDDVCDIGGGMPLFKDFGFEDWAMMGLMFELSLIAQTFEKDVNDPERPGMLVDHIPFYFTKYFKKQLSPKAYGVDTMQELIELCSDTVKMTEKGTLESLMGSEMESLQVYVQITEEARRHRKYRMDLGEESAKLKISQSAHTLPAAAGKTTYGAAKGAGKTGTRFSPYAAATPGRIFGQAKGKGKGA